MANFFRAARTYHFICSTESKVMKSVRWLCPDMQYRSADFEKWKLPHSAGSFREQAARIIPPHFALYSLPRYFKAWPADSRYTPRRNERLELKGVSRANIYAAIACLL